MCERRVGCGVTAREVGGKLPFPEREMIPVSLEEQTVCYVDRFFSKNHAPGEKEKTVAEIISTIFPQGDEKVDIFRKWLKKFDI